MAVSDGTVATTGRDARDVACVGDNCVDVLRSRGDVEVAGGNALNVAVNLAAMSRRVGYFGAVGGDRRGDLILASARGAGVDVAGVDRRDGPTGVTIVEHGPGGERIFVEEDYGVAAEHRLDGITAALLTEYRWIHLARQPDVDLLSARRGGSTAPRISYDAGDHTGSEELARIAPSVDVLFLSTVGSELDAYRLAEELQRTCGGVVVVTMGAKGAVALDPDGRFLTQAAVPVAEVVDTLGAGDAFIAGFIDAQLDGSSLGGALLAATAAGAEAVSGSRPSRPPTIVEASP
jgi:fructoselysine 6-kinase